MLILDHFRELPLKVDRTAMLKHLRRKKVLTISDVSNVLECAVITARRCMKNWNASRSCNQNGKFYTFPEIPSFDDHGLWRYEGVLFSKHGNLVETLIHFIKVSQAGMSGSEMTLLTGLSSNSSIVYQLRDNGHLRIERVGGRVALFDADKAHFERQRAAREIQQSVSMPKCEDALMILVELIKRPGIELPQIARTLRDSGRKVSEASIYKLLEKHGLLKKIPDTT